MDRFYLFYFQNQTKYIGGHADLLGGIAAGNRDFIKSLAPVI